MICLWVAFLYGFILSGFEFFSDDFGYFLNFRQQILDGNSVGKILTSYLTGGVPRLQVGWHIIHQILFYFNGIDTTFYFLLEILLIALIGVMFYLFLLGYYRDKAAFFGALILVTSSFYQESFYWVSANYGFFQLLFFLAALLLYRKSLESHFKFFYISMASLSLAACILFMEQAIPLLVVGPLVAFILARERYGSVAKTRSFFFGVGAFVSLVLLFIPQLFMIKMGSKTSLVDTFNMYYPKPFLSALENLPEILRKTFFSFIPDLKYIHLMLYKNDIFSKDDFKVWIVHLIIFLVLAITTCVLFLRSTSFEKKSNDTLMRERCIGGILWFFGASVVVIPILHFESRYVFLILPAAIFLVLNFIEKLFEKKWFLTSCSFLLFLSAAEISAFYNGPYFSLIAMEKKTFSIVEHELRKNKDVKAVVFLNFPGNFHDALSGVFINYHATEWWLRWKSLPEDFGSHVVGNEVANCVSGGERGFRLIYGDYPKERLQQCFSKNSTLFVERIGEGVYSPDIRLSYRDP